MFIQKSRIRCDTAHDIIPSIVLMYYFLGIRLLTVQVDDEAAVYSKGEVLHDTFAISGSQWYIVYTVYLNTDVLVMKRFNSVSISYHYDNRKVKTYWSPVSAPSPKLLSSHSKILFKKYISSLRLQI